MIEARLERVDHRRAAGRLRRVHLRQRAAREAEVVELAEAAPQAGQQRSARHRRHHVRRHRPVELFGDLERARLGAFRVVRAEVDVGEAPAVPIRDLRAQPVDVVVGAVDRHDPRAVHRRSDDLAGLEVVGDEDEAGQAQACRVRGDAVGEVARRRAREHARAELDRPGRSHRHDAVLVRQRRVIHAIVLDVDRLDPEAGGEPVGPDERRPARREPRAGLAGDGQQLAVPPQVARARRDGRARQRLRGPRIVVHGLERAEAGLADETRRGRIRGVTHVALEPGERV